MVLELPKKVFGFSCRQIRQIKQGGLKVFLKKSYKLGLISCDVIFCIPALLIVLIVRALRPLIIIRFGFLDADRIGSFSGDIEVYLCEREKLFKKNKPTIDIFYYRVRPFSNLQLKKMWERTLYICQFARLIDKVNYYLPGGRQHSIQMRPLLERDFHGVLPCTKPHLSFTAKEEQKGMAALKKVGLSFDTPFICFYIRDKAYLSATYFYKDWNYHNYRDGNIQNCILAAEEMAGRGYFLFRMGAIVHEKLKTNNPRIIDYATQFRSDFLDIYLSAKCRFFIGSAAGLTSIPIIFRRPTIWINLIPFEYAPSWASNTLFIPKKLWLRKEHRFMAFREILESGAGRFHKAQEYEKMNIEVIENTPEEIRDVTVEMEERLNGIWQTTAKDEDLQRRFWSLFQKSNLHGKIIARISAEFLRQHKNLLD